jgi:hypothetical protein
MSRPFVAVGAVPRLDVVRAVDVIPAVEVVPAKAESAAPAHSLRRFAGWLSALLADDGMNARFTAERGRHEGLVRRVEQQRRP